MVLGKRVVVGRVVVVGVVVEVMLLMLLMLMIPMIPMMLTMLTMLIPKCHTTITTRGSIMLGGRSSMMGGRSSMMGGRNSMMGGGRQSMLKSRGRRSTAKITLPGPSSTTASSVRESSFVVIHVWWYSFCNVPIRKRQVFGSLLGIDLISFCFINAMTNTISTSIGDRWNGKWWRTTDLSHGRKVRQRTYNCLKHNT